MFSQPGEREHRERRGDRHLGGLGRHHELAVVEPVGDHARVEAEEHERQKAAEHARPPTASGEPVSSTTNQASAMFCIHVPASGSPGR